MTKQEFLNYCTEIYSTIPDYPFKGDCVTTAVRHSDTQKWYGIVMRLSRRKFGFDSEEMIDVVNMKLPMALVGCFGKADGIYPAYHMNKLHWISVLLPDTSDDLVRFLIDVSFEETKTK